MKKSLQPVLDRMSDSRQFISNTPELASGMSLAEKDFTLSEEAGVQAGLLATFKRKVMDCAETIKISDSLSTTGNFGPFVPAILPVVVAWYPNFPLKDLISVQDMEQELSYIIISELLVGSNKADTTKGGKVETPAGPRVISGRYPTGEIFGEEIDEFVKDGSDSVGVVAYNPVAYNDETKDLFRVQVDGTTPVTDGVVASVNGDTLSFESATVSTFNAELNLTTGVFKILGVAPSDITKVTFDYAWNLEYATKDSIPVINESFTNIPMVAKPRALSFPISVFAEYTKKKQYGDDARLNTANRVLNLMYQFQVRYILTRMYRGAKGTAQTIAVGGSTGIDLNVRVQTVLQKLNNVSQLIMDATGRIEGNTLVVGGAFKSFLESLPDIFFKAEDSGKDTGFQGPRKIGKFGRYSVFYDDQLPMDGGWMSYKGGEWYDAPYYLGVFMPITPTDAINLNVSIEQAFVSMEAHKYDKPQAVFPITFTF